MDDQTYWHEGEPRIVASGRWEQDEFGAATYIPDHIRPSTAPPADADAAPVSDVAERTGADGYRIRSDTVWAAARRDYLAGDAAEAVCARYDLKLGTLRSRAAREGWRRSDIEDIWPDPQDEYPDADPPDLSRMAAQALMRLNRALQRGRAVEAASWLRTWRALSSVNLADPALLAAVAPEPEPDPAATLDADLKAVAEVARDAARLSPDDHAAAAPSRPAWPPSRRGWTRRAGFQTIQTNWTLFFQVRNRPRPDPASVILRQAAQRRRPGDPAAPGGRPEGRRVAAKASRGALAARSPSAPLGPPVSATPRRRMTKGFNSPPRSGAAPVRTPPPAGRR